jgi:hypothetical protein
MAAASNSPPINATGIKGFLLWFAREQPAIYAKIAPSLPSIAPKAFSNYNAKMGVLFRKFSADRPGLGALGAAVQFRKFMADRPGLGSMTPFRPPYERSPGLPQEIYGLQGLAGSVQFRQFMADRPGLGKATYRRIGAMLRNRQQRLGVKKMAGFGDTSNAAYFSTAMVAPTDAVTVNYTDVLSEPVDVGTIDPGDVSDINTIAPVASSANTGVSTTPVAAAIGSVIGAASSVYMTSQQAAMQNSLVQTNLQRAAAGLPPLNTSLSGSGVPIVSSTGSLGSGGLLFLLALGIGAVALASS